MYVGEFTPNGWVRLETVPWYRKEPSETFKRKATTLLFQMLKTGWELGVTDDKYCGFRVTNNQESREIETSQIKQVDELCKNGWFIDGNWKFLLKKDGHLVKLPCASKRIWCYGKSKVRIYIVTDVDVDGSGKLMVNGPPLETKEVHVQVPDKVKWVSYGES